MNSNLLYFFLARYLAFWAKQVLKRWQPIIIAVSGSAGKTTTLELLETLLTPHIPLKVSHKANSATGIPLNILGLKQETFKPLEWLVLLLLAPVKSFSTPKASLYLCELDADRQDEMKYHMALLQPDITCFTSLFASHTGNYPGEDEQSVLKLMTKEFGLVFEKTKKLIIANGDDPLLLDKIPRGGTPAVLVSNLDEVNPVLKISKYSVSLTGTEITFSFNKPLLFSIFKSAATDVQQLQDCPDTFSFKLPLGILPKSSAVDLGLAVLTALICNVPLESITQSLLHFRLPHGRLNLFAGIKATTIIDSTYNSSRVAAIEALQMLKTIGDKKTIAILGDMRELGILSKTEHQAVAQEIINTNVRKVLLIGPMMNDFVKPVLLQAGYKEENNLFCSLYAKDGLEITLKPGFIEGGETILIKGSQNTLFLEGIAEKLLASSKDIQNLCRREALWEQKRQAIYS